MYIKEISIKNFRNFGTPAFVMKLKPFTLILGENNIGKSNLLKAIGLILSQDLSVFRQRMLEIDDINYSSVMVFKKEVANRAITLESIVFPEVRIDITLSKMDDDQKAIVADWFIDHELEKAKITYFFAPKDSFDKVVWIEKQREKLGENKNDYLKIDFPIEEYRYSIFGGNDSTNECQQYLLRMLKIEYLDALRNAEQELVAGGGARLLYRVLAQGENAGYENIKEGLNTLSGIVKENATLKDIKTRIGTLLSQVSLDADGNGNSIDFQFSSPETSEILKKISLIYGANPIDVSRNGLGRNNLLYIALILSHLSNRDKQGSEPYFRCIGIEEPEAHLHPQLQDHLAENIGSIQKKDSGCMQLLLTSHSTHIAAKLCLKNTVILYNDRIDGRIRGHYVLEGLDVKEDKKSIRYLSKFIDATQSRLFFARRVILVEGISEKILLPVFFKVHSQKTLEQGGYEVINVQGVAFCHFLKIIKNGYFIKCLVLTDSDEGKKKVENRAADLKSNFEDKILIKVEVSNTSTFEKDLIEANKNGEGKKTLLRALKDTKPKNGVTFEEKCKDKEIDVEDFFGEIEDYKSEFALNLKRRLEKEDKLTIPKYITDGFTFLMDKNGKD
ncbi:MAG: AAA family ATPase [Planctomycetaceae bacterium]|nr:AAA family ATPase [Planctomycetaceae bacterium]